MNTRSTEIDRIGKMLAQRHAARIEEFATIRYAAERIRLDRVTALPQRKQALYGGVELGLTTAEFDLCLLLMSRPMMTFTRDIILDCINAPDVLDRNVDSHVKRIRQKFRKASGGDFNPIITRYKFGYHWNAETKPEVEIA